MRSKTIIGLILLFVLIFSISINAQEPKEQKIELPRLFLEQKLDQTIVNLASVIAVSIVYVKSLGKTPEEYGKFIGETFAPLWKGLKGKGIAPFISGISWTLLSDSNVKIEILKESEDFVEGKTNRFGEAYAKNFLESGLTLDEYDLFWGKCFEAIADYLGLKYEQKTEGDWIVFTVTKKKVKGN